VEQAARAPTARGGRPALGSLGLLLVAALAGYLAGSISFARLVGRIAAPGGVPTTARLEFDAGGAVEVEGVSATNVSISAGRRWGLLVVVLDIAKAAAGTLVFLLIAPDEPAYLVAATFAVVGHIWPIWHRFRGGFGVTPILGGLLVIDPVALLVVLPVSVVIGLVLADRLIVFDGWTLLLAPWFVLVRGDAQAALYATIVALLYWWAMRVEVRAHVARLRAGPRDRRSRFADIRKGYTGHPEVG
jgi:acyl phosphate:glycerol-3-phosphate acyltransferase